MASQEKSEKTGAPCEFLQEIEEEEVKFDSASYHRLHTYLLQLVEEVKLRRLTDIENEEKIEKLTREKNDLERQIDCEHQAKFNLTECSDQKMEEMKNNYQEKIYSLRDQVRKLQYRKEYCEKEAQSLKDEVRRLQWDKYSAEKKLKEQDLKLTACKSTAEHQQEEINKVDKKIMTAKKHYDTLVNVQQRLEKNVNEAMKLNNGLMYINQHHTCLMSEQKKDNSKLRQQIIDLNVQLNHKPIHPVPVLQLEEKLGDLERTVSQERAWNERMKKELECSQEKFEEVKKLLQESEKHVDQQLTHANKHQTEAQEQREKYEATNTELIKHRNDLATLQQELREEKSRHEASLIQWSQQEKELANEVSRLQEELMVKESAILELEESNIHWAKKNSDLLKEFKDLQGHVSVEKVHKEVQKGLSFLHLRTGSTQTKLSETSQSSQTEPPETRTIPSQCIIPALANIGTQTHSIDGQDSSIPQPIKSSDTSLQPTKASVKSCSQYVQTDVNEVQQIKESLTSVALATVATQCDLVFSQQVQVQTNHPDCNNGTQSQKTDSTNQITGNQVIDRSAMGLTPPTRRSFQLPPVKTNLFHSQSQDMTRHPVTSLCSPDLSRQVNSKRALNRESLPCASSVTWNSFDSQAKYRRLSKVEASPSERSMRMMSPFPSMGVKVVSARKESSLGVPIQPDFIGEVRSRDLGQSPVFPDETRSLAVVTTCKSILKGSLTFNPSGSTNKTKCVKFQESHEEREFVPPSPEAPESFHSQQQEYKSLVIHSNQATSNQSKNPANSSIREEALTEERKEIEEIQEHIRQVHKSMGTNFTDGCDNIDF